MVAKPASKTTDNAQDSVSIEAVQKGVERVVEANKEYIEAMVQSMTTAAKGLETLSTENLAFAKRSVEEGMKTAKAFMAVKTLQDYITLQTEYTRSTFDQFVNQATKINDLTQSLTKETYAPINSRVVAFAEEIKKARAA